ncbi:FAD-binding protein [Agrobacterium radiobacter]|uniref:FAD-binding protein n=1 Tax=Agrobacterium radiobacter TaxID=362 RepID=UPI003F84323D
MPQEWDTTVDLLVAGTGAAALAAAIAAADDGAKVLVVEGTEKWGGTTFLSGGGVWLPNNPVMRRQGATDSADAALKYMEAIIEDVGPASSRARKEAFVNGVADPVLTLEKYGLKWIRSKVYPDYFSHLPGGTVGRCLEVKAFDIKKLGDWYAKTRAEETMPLPLNLDDFADLARGYRNIRGATRALRVGARIWSGKLRGQDLRGMGVALSCAMMHIVQKQKSPVWLNALITELVMAEGVVVGGVISKDGREHRIRTTKGVFLGTGGFARNRAWREKYQGIPGWSATAPGDTGSGIQIGMDAGADVAMLDLMWGVPVIPFLGDDTRGTLLIWERSMPHSLVVDQNGDRFINESIPYVEFIQGILNHSKSAPAIPSWIISDNRHTERYVNLAAMIGVEKLEAVGTIVNAQTLDELARKLGMPPAKLSSTVQRFNSLARRGVDEDFHRGENAYENYYGDPRYPNPNLGEVSVGPFRALKVLPGDIGTKGGLLTDEYARVIDKNGKPISGLYAAGNATASVMGQTYAGAGGTLGPAIVFGFIGARHAVKGGSGNIAEFPAATQ